APLDGTPAVPQLRAKLDRGPILEGAAPSRKEGRGPRRSSSFSGVVGGFPGASRTIFKGPGEDGEEEGSDGTEGVSAAVEASQGTGGPTLTSANLASISLDLVGHVTSASRQYPLSHENVTQSPNPFQHYSQCSGNFTSLAWASPPNAPQRFACLRACTTPPSPSSPLLTLSHPRPYHLYAHVVPSQHASDTASHPYACVVPSQHAPNTAYHSYACRVPSRHSPNTTYPYTCVMPSQPPPNTAYHPYTREVHSRHAPDTTYPYAYVVPSQHAPYTRGVPCQHAPDTAYHPYARGVHS
ncbi:hypothetical protein O181_124834, partial [Austropuccinia psidii MF-1]|nr:hypothetical protein [Austropuccinia psidii MF-1]